MKRLYIVVEGQTEEEFVKSVLYPYFMEKGIFVSPIIIHTNSGHKGGFVNYHHLKNDVLRLLRTENDIIVSTFVDYFRCPDVPEKSQWENIVDHGQRVSVMQQCMAQDVNDSRFVPYIQLHEFEALLFSNANGFSRYYEGDKLSQLEAIVNNYPCPEGINSSPQGAPSKRILAIDANYDKVIWGNCIALEVGLDAMMAHCLRFKAWLENLVQLCQ